MSPGAAEAADTADSSGTRLHSLLLTGTVGGVPSHKLQWRCAQHTHPGKQPQVLLTPEPAFVGYSSNDSARDDGEALSVPLAPAGIFMAASAVRTFSLKIRARPNAQKLTEKLWLDSALHLLNGTWRTKRSGKHSVCPIQLTKQPPSW